MPTASNVVATTPFLTVDQVAAELGITPLAVRRLIALKLLTANRMVADTGEWKITPAALERYAAGDRKRMLMPALDAGWFNTSDIDNIGGGFALSVARLIYSLTPDECPLRDRDGKPISGTVPMGGDVASQILTMARMPTHSETRRELRSPETKFPNCGSVFLASELSKRTYNAVRRAKLPSGMNPQGEVATLFDSPENYRRFVDAGWNHFAEANTKFSTSRHYPNSASVSFTVPHTVVSNAIGLSVVEPLTF